MLNQYFLFYIFNVKNENIKELESEIRKQDEKREKLYTQIGLHKETIIKADVHNSELQSKVQAQSIEISTLRKVSIAFKLHQLNTTVLFKR